MIRLFEKDLKDDGRTSSKGNQLKWKSGDTWYKQDYLGYEGFSEYVVSHLLVMSTLSKDEFVLYETEEISYNNHIKLGCKSIDFLKEDEEFITLERLYKNKYGRSFFRDIYGIEDHVERARYFIKFLGEYVKEKVAAHFLYNLIVIDMFFRNEDRHMNNIGLIRSSNGKFRLCPIFDNGACLLSDLTINYTLEDDCIDSYDKKSQSKLISFNYEDAFVAISEIIGEQTKLRFLFTLDDVKKIIDDEPYYDNRIKERVYEVIKHAMTKYSFIL